jgi:hypothetical protein
LRWADSKDRSLVLYSLDTHCSIGSFNTKLAECLACFQWTICINVWKSSTDHICLKLLGICGIPQDRQRRKQWQMGREFQLLERNSFLMNVIFYLILCSHLKTLMHQLKEKRGREWHLEESQYGAQPEAANAGLFGSCKENNCLATNYLVESI